jgi:cytoskeletal protein CcmA (bactofilin family)
MNPDHFQVKNFNFIGLNSQTDGDLSFYGKTYFFGKHQGNIFQLDEDDMTIQQEAEINGDLTAHNANIYGRISGNITISGTLNIFSGGVVEGSIKTQNLNIHPGALISGEINSDDS